MSRQISCLQALMPVPPCRQIPAGILLRFFSRFQCPSIHFIFAGLAQLITAVHAWKSPLCIHCTVVVATSPNALAAVFFYARRSALINYCARRPFSQLYPPQFKLFSRQGLSNDASVDDVFPRPPYLKQVSTQPAFSRNRIFEIAFQRPFC